MFFIQYSVLSNYADDLFVIGINEEVINSLVLLDIEVVKNWFYENFIVLNPGKSYYMCLGENVNENEVLNFDEPTTKSSKEVEILGMKMTIT